ncbi:hypothetical protein VFPPC_16149 [Pochonia chlamydosporia 170]|uniref:RRM domain-containing protein n=1 Tax=Pochonia chlamydosporia 170 TaxID=1380566 RepID=A0A179FF80_METCM|nr:hypothetical protein VFPPC_16149 [Pochonia chlamydosporia 170]OAQ64057.2 hypothetical protein VFPPC_16149 [Pochonia chlamydosporia 170]
MSNQSRSEVDSGHHGSSLAVPVPDRNSSSSNPSERHRASWLTTIEVSPDQTQQHLQTQLPALQESRGGLASIIKRQNSRGPPINPTASPTTLVSAVQSLDLTVPSVCQGGPQASNGDGISQQNPSNNFRSAVPNLEYPINPETTGLSGPSVASQQFASVSGNSGTKEMNHEPQLQRLTMTPEIYSDLVTNLIQQSIQVGRNTDSLLQTISAEAFGNGTASYPAHVGTVSTAVLHGPSGFPRPIDPVGFAASRKLTGHVGAITSVSSNAANSSYAFHNAGTIGGTSPAATPGFKENDAVNIVMNDRDLTLLRQRTGNDNSSWPTANNLGENCQNAVFEQVPRPATISAAHEPTQENLGHHNFISSNTGALTHLETTGLPNLAHPGIPHGHTGHKSPNQPGCPGSRPFPEPRGSSHHNAPSAPAGVPGINRPSDTRGPFSRINYPNMRPVPETPYHQVNTTQTRGTTYRATPVQNTTQIISTPTSAITTGTQATGFVPMLAVTRPDMIGRDVTPMPLGSQAVVDLKFSPRYHGMHTESNASADHLRPDQNCALWITQLPPDVTVSELLAEIRQIGRVFATFINRSDGVQHPKSAAKLVFFKPQEAQKLLSRISHSPLVVRGHKAQMALNRIKYEEHTTERGESRVLIITGHRRFVNEDSLTAYFEGRFAFQIDQVQTLVQFGNRAVVEYKFGSYRCQSQMGMKALLLDRPIGLEMVEFGADPCEVGSETTSFSIAGERIQGHGFNLSVME